MYHRKYPFCTDYTIDSKQVLREHGEILFEIATDPPGFAHDESLETMGEELKLPEQYEQHRKQIEQTLLPFEVRNLD
ncbi:hypothetical protein F8158_06665 [Bacillus cereus]|uniref:Ring-cleaving dioxygenase n=1 Tax=Bacillus cereus TaxID=1396 RepID=A0AB34DAR6_BACCE|nr:hypothetical protein F8158_06665 [Bacillus cereus]